MTTFGVSSYFVSFGTFFGKMMPASHEILQRAWKENGRLSLFLFMLKAKLQSSRSHLEEEEIQIFKMKNHPSFCKVILQDIIYLPS